MKVPNSVDAPHPTQNMPEASTSFEGSSSAHANNKFEFTDTPDDEMIDRAVDTTTDVDFASVGPAHNFPRQPALDNHALPHPLA